MAVLSSLLYLSRVLVGADLGPLFNRRASLNAPRDLSTLLKQPNLYSILLIRALSNDFTLLFGKVQKTVLRVQRPSASGLPAKLL